MSKPSGDFQAERPRLTGRDIIVSVRRGPIALIEQILDIELRLPVLVNGGKDSEVEAHESRQVHGVVR